MERKYSVILGNLGNTKDRFCGGYKTNPTTMEMLKQAAAIEYVKGIELVGTWDIDVDNAKGMKRALDDLGLQCVSIIPDLFANKLYWKGAYTSKEAAVRRQAIDYTKQMCDVAEFLGCPTINIWAGQDGYDYLFTADYIQEREYARQALVELAEAYPKLKFALEYKPKEPRTHSYMARLGDTLLLALSTGCDNVGISIDTGHSVVAGENVAEAIAIAGNAGRLFHMHFNDNYAFWDDDMIVGSIHSVPYLEMLYWLDRVQYAGWLSMDQYPYREDAASAIKESVEWLVWFDELQRTHKEELDEVIRSGDPVLMSKTLRQMMAGKR